MIDWSRIRVACLDLDGVVYEGRRAVPGAIEAITRMSERGLTIYFVTNNSARRLESIERKLLMLGVRQAEGRVVSAGAEAGRVLKARGVEHAIVIGTGELRSQVEECGVRTIDTGPRDLAVSAAVLVGFDPNLEYRDIDRASYAVRTGSLFVAANLERTYPSDGGVSRPGCGAAVAAISFASSREPDLVIGKPEGWLLEAVARRTGARFDEMVMIGDTLESDVAMARRCGAAAVFVDRDGRASGGEADEVWRALSCFGV